MRISDWSSDVCSSDLLGGDHLDVYVATSALQDVHKIQPRPSLIAKYRQADQVVCTGSELEIGWLPPLAQKGNNQKVIPCAHGACERKEESSVGKDSVRKGRHRWARDRYKQNKSTIK